MGTCYEDVREPAWVASNPEESVVMRLREYVSAISTCEASVILITFLAVLRYQPWPFLK